MDSFPLFILLFWQEEMLKKKYGGLLSKKPPLISKVELDLLLESFVLNGAMLSMVDLGFDYIYLILLLECLPC